MVGDAIRLLCLRFYKISGKLEPLLLRANYTAVGFSGHGSALDSRSAAKKHLRPLNRFERWWLKPYIEAERDRRWDIFRQVCANVLGEDITTYPV